MKFFSALFGGKKSAVAGIDPVAAARADVNRLRLYAINVQSNAILQQQVFQICEHITVCLAEAERKPGKLAALGDLLLITLRMKTSLEEWTRLTLNGARTEGEAQSKRDLEKMFTDLVGQYAALRTAVMAENATDLKVNVEVITGFLSGKLPGEARPK